MTALPTCRHCTTRPSVRGRRGLCWPCYDKPAVRHCYSFLPGKFVGPGVGTENARRPLPATPTSHLPGSEEKQAVMEQRLAAGEHLHHPDDARS